MAFLGEQSSDSNSITLLQVYDGERRVRKSTLTLTTINILELSSYLIPAIVTFILFVNINREEPTDQFFFVSPQDDKVKFPMHHSHTKNDAKPSTK